MYMFALCMQITQANQLVFKLFFLFNFFFICNSIVHILMLVAVLQTVQYHSIANCLHMFNVHVQSELREVKDVT